MALSKLVKVGFAPETAWGDAAAATKLLPINGEPKFTPTIPRILDNARRGTAAKDFAAYEGAGYGELELTGPVYPDLIGYFIKSLLGTITTSGAGPYTHAGTMNSNPAYSLNFEDNSPVQARSYSGAKCESLSFKFSSRPDGGLLEYTAKFKCKKPTTISAAAVTAEPEAPWPGWQSTFTIGGSPFTRIISGEWMLNRPAEPNHTANNTKDCNRIDQGELEATSKFLTDADSDDLLKYLAVTQEACAATFTNSGAGAALRSLLFQTTKVDYGDGPAERDLGSTNIRLNWNIRALNNATDAGPIKITLTNGQTSI